MSAVPALEPHSAYITRLAQAIAFQEDEWLKSQFEGQHYTDISAVLEWLTTEESKYIFGLLSPDICADILSELDTPTRKGFLQAFEPAEVALILQHAESDDAADILNDLPIRRREEVLAAMEPEKADDLADLLNYDEDCAGGLMAKELIRANINWSIKQCIEEIRRQATKVDKILTIYVVDDHDHLLGRVSVKKIILSPDQTRIADIYEPDLKSVQTYDELPDVADMMQKYDLESVPVVNLQGKLLGRITIDDVMDLITEQADMREKFMSGLTEDITEEDSIWALSRARLPWLLIGMVGGLAGAQFIGLFEAELSVVPAMAFFIPLITATGGNVGIQSSTLVIQALSSSTDHGPKGLSRLLKVLAVALINGLVIASVVFGFNLLVSGLELARVVAVAIFCVVLLASLLGTFTPVLLDRLGINPALASGPFITTANDLLGLAVYFGVARMMYQQI